jgi:Zn-dependent protease with chaperone function
MKHHERDEVRRIFGNGGGRGGQEPPPEGSESADGGSQFPVPLDRVRLPGLSPRAYEHPADAAALSALRRLKGFDTVVRWMIGALSERRLRYWFLAGAVRVNERQFAELHRTLLECCAILDLPEIPELYVMQNPVVNAGAVGADKPFVVLNSAIVDLLSPDEWRFVIGHELGHILSGHVLYKNLLEILLQLSLGRLASVTPMSGLAIWALIAALREWDRKSELSADRAGLLCLQNPPLAYGVNMKMAGGAHTDRMSVEEFVKQAEEYESGGDVRDGALKLLNLLGRTHPFPVLRLAELKRWVDAGAYGRIVAGDYPRRHDAGSMYDDVSAAMRDYRANFTDSKDPFMKMLNDLGEGIGQAGSAIWDQLKELFGGKAKN